MCDSPSASHHLLEADGLLPPRKSCHQFELYCISRHCIAGVFTFDGREWEVVTEAAKDMITQMLVLDFSKRATAKQLCQHRWFQVRSPCYCSRSFWKDLLLSGHEGVCHEESFEKCVLSMLSSLTMNRPS
jgi:serine/threonine protein kinase